MMVRTLSSQFTWALVVTAGLSFGHGISQARAEKTPAGPTINGTVKEVDATKKTVTLIIPKGNGTKESSEETYPLNAESKIALAHGLKKESKDGQLADVTPRTSVQVQLTADKKAVALIVVHGGSLQGHIKSIDVAKKLITLATKDEKEKQVVEKTFQLVDDGKVILDDGLGNKKDPPKETKLANLKEGMTVRVQLSGYDRKLAVGIQATGPMLNGSIGGVDVGNSTITISVKEDGNVVDKVLTVHKDVRIDGNGKLADLVAGTRANVRLSVEDQKTVVGIHLPK